MNLAELDAMITDQPGSGAILLTEPDWKATMLDTAAAEHIRFERGELGYVYRGLPVYIVFDGRSRMMSMADAVQDGLAQSAV